YLIKVYKIGTWLQFSNGIEIRKVIASAISIIAVFGLFFIMGLKVNPKIFSFFLNYWLVISVFIPAVIVFLFFGLDYENKGIFGFFKDRVKYLFNHKRQYEHFIDVPTKQMYTDLSFEKFTAEKEVSTIDKEDVSEHVKK